MTLLSGFLLLQAADFATTMIGIRVGAAEASPFIARLMATFGVLGGLIVTKAVGCGVYGLSIAFRRPGAVRKFNWLLGAVVLWNASVILRLAL